MTYDKKTIKRCIELLQDYKRTMEKSFPLNEGAENSWRRGHNEGLSNGYANAITDLERFLKYPRAF